MQEALLTFVPLLAFMLVPLWIPLVAVAIGTLMDAVRSIGTTRAGSRQS